jgi:predicted DNA-binding WGR domain protein
MGVTIDETSIALAWGRRGKGGVFA